MVSVAWLLRGTGHRALFVRGQVAPARDLLEKEGGARRERRGELFVRLVRGLGRGVSD